MFPVEGTQVVAQFKIVPGPYTANLTTMTTRESGLCKYKDIAGKPGEGAHAWRIGGLAGTDLLLTAGAAALLTWGGAFRKASGDNALIAFFIVFIILMIVAVAVHRLFCVDTALNRWLGLAPSKGS